MHGSKIADTEFLVKYNASFIKKYAFLRIVLHRTSF